VSERLNPAQIRRYERAYRKPTLNLSDLSQHATVEICMNLGTLSDHQLQKQTNMQELRSVDQVLADYDSRNHQRNQSLEVAVTCLIPYGSYGTDPSGS
jgi:hypothetical protein